MRRNSTYGRQMKCCGISVYWHPMRKISFRQKIRIALQAAFDRHTPLSAKGILLGGALYGVLPIDLIPDLLPLLGIADDAVVILGALLTFLHWTKDLRKALEATA